MKIGEIEILPVVDKTIMVDPRKVIDRPLDTWGNHLAHLDEGKLRLDFGGFLICSGDRRILVDLGYGNGDMITALNGLGVDTGSITDVIFTHLHLDHIGWASDGQVATFPHATYHCDAADWDYFVAEDAAFAGHHDTDPSPGEIKLKMGAIRSQVSLWDADTTIAPGVSVRRTPGHTPGSSIAVISSGRERAVLLGDVAHCPAELVEDDWDAVVDVDPEMARAAREVLARELAGTDVAIGAAHFPGLEFGRLLQIEGSRRWIYDLGSASPPSGGARRADGGSAEATSTKGAGNHA